MQRYIENLKGLFGTQEYECVLMAIHLLDSLEQEIMQDTRKHPALWRINDRDIWQKTLHLAHQGFSLSKTFDKLAATIDLLNGGQFLEGYTRTLHIRAAIIDNADTLYMTKDKQISIIPSDFIVNRKVGESQRHYTAFNQTSSRALGLSLSAGENNPGSRQDIHTHEAEEITFSGAENIAFVDYNGLISELSLRYGFAPCSNLAKVLMRDILHAAACGKDLEDCYQGIRLNEMEKLPLKRMMEEIDIASLEERYSHQMPFGCLVRIPAGYSHTLHNTDVLAPSIDWTFKDIFTRLFRSSGEAIVSSRCAFVPARVEHGNGWSIYSHILPAMAAQLETDEEGKIIFKQDATASYNPDASLVMDVDFKIITIKPAHMTGIIPFAPLYPGVQFVRFMPWPKDISAGWDTESDGTKLKATMGILRTRGPPENLTLSSSNQIVLNNNVGENPITGFTLANNSEGEYEIIFITASEHIGARAFARLIEQIDLSRYGLKRIPLGSSAAEYAALLKTVTNFGLPHVQEFLGYAKDLQGENEFSTLYNFTRQLLEWQRDFRKKLKKNLLLNQIVTPTYNIDFLNLSMNMVVY